MSLAPAKPVLTWPGNDDIGLATVTAGTSWLTLDGLYQETLRLRGGCKLNELAALLSRGLARLTYDEELRVSGAVGGIWTVLKYRPGGYIYLAFNETEYLYRLSYEMAQSVVSWLEFIASAEKSNAGPLLVMPASRGAQVTILNGDITFDIYRDSIAELRLLLRCCGDSLAPNACEEPSTEARYTGPGYETLMFEPARGPFGETRYCMTYHKGDRTITSVTLNQAELAQFELALQHAAEATVR